MPTIFDSVKLSRVKSSQFDLSHDVKLSFNMGELVPILCLEAVPGDRFNISAESLLRFQPLVAPVMHQMDVTMHYFFVPNRILWPKWEDFITNTKTLGVLPAVPTIYMDYTRHTPLADYLGVPKPANDTLHDEISALPFAAYQKIYNDYYRDQNLIPEVPVELIDGNQPNNIFTPLRKRAWEHDYFTSALPFAQKGEAVSLPLGSVTLKDDWSAGNPIFTRADGSYANGDVANQTGEINVGIDAQPYAYDPNDSLEVTPTTINDLRQAFSLQKWLEKMARGGTRYIEVIKSHFNINSSDKRLQRPEYITGTKSPVVISEVLNTTGTTEAAQGTMAGHGISVTAGKNGYYSCEEHGYILGIMSVLPKPAYMQGLSRHWSKKDPTDYAWPDFANLGEQPVLQKEIMAFQGATDNDTFGYVPRYAEYKYEPSRVAGDFKTTLDYWHLARKFATIPALNQTFIEVDSVSTDRIFAVTDPEEQKLLCHVFNKVSAIRPLPKFGIPTF